MKNNKFCVFLDAGHGGTDRHGNYTTSPDKMHRHIVCDCHQEGWFYEGVWNRELTERVSILLHDLRVPHCKIYHPWMDTPLQSRLMMANQLAKHFDASILISNHANAGGGSGYEHYTSPGYTRSDRLGELQWESVQRYFGDSITFRSDTSDGDHDKEARFYVLTRSVMPALLVEHLFFDHHEDVQLLMEEDVIDRFAQAQVETIMEYQSRVL